MSLKNNINKFSLEKNTWCGIKITNAAARQILKLTESNANMLGLRLWVKQSGCVGLGYALDKMTKLNTTDLVFKHNGAKLFVPPKAMPFIDGTEIDYVKEGLNHIFKFNNPKAQHACGCGESFGL